MEGAIRIGTRNPDSSRCWWRWVSWDSGLHSRRFSQHIKMNNNSKLLTLFRNIINWRSLTLVKWEQKGKSSPFYVALDNSTEVDELTDEFNPKEGRNIGARDFMGHDFTAWVYDRHPPRETYQERGIHPSGVRLNRYIKFSDLTFDERTFWRRQARLQWLNLLDPYLIGLKGWRIPTSTSVRVQSEYVDSTAAGLAHSPSIKWNTDFP